MLHDERKDMEKLADEAERALAEECEKRDRKEKRGVTKQTLYDGSKKLKHSIPKGKLLK